MSQIFSKMDRKWYKMCSETLRYNSLHAFKKAKLLSSIIDYLPSRMKLDLLTFGIWFKVLFSIFT